MNLLSIYFFYYYKEFLDWRVGNYGCYRDCYYKDYFDTWREVMLFILLLLLLMILMLFLLLLSLIFFLTNWPLLFDSSNKSFADLICLTPTVLLFSLFPPLTLLPPTLFLLNFFYNCCICCSKLSIILTLFLPKFAIFFTYNWCCWL